VNLRKKIIKNKENDYEEMAGAVEAMRNVVRQYRLGNLPSGEFSLNDLEEYCRHLIDIQEEDGSWTVSSRPDELAEDEKVEFLVYPTYIGLGTLVMADEYLPGRDFPGREEALARGFAALKLEGYGEDSLFQVIEMILMLIEAGVPPWLGNRRDRAEYKPAAAHLVAFRDRLQNRLDRGDTVLPYGGDYRPIFELLVAGLSVL